jgi:hypothetical protein
MPEMQPLKSQMKPLGQKELWVNFYTSPSLFSFV